MQFNRGLLLLAGVSIAHHDLEIRASFGKRLERGRKNSRFVFSFLTPQHDTFYRHGHGWSSMKLFSRGRPDSSFRELSLVRLKSWACAERMRLHFTPFGYPVKKGETSEFEFSGSGTTRSCSRQKHPIGHCIRRRA